MIIASSVSVGTAVVQVASPDDNPQIVILHNEAHDSANDLFIGPIDVTTASGLHLPKGETLTVHLDAGDALFAIGDGGPIDIRVLQTKR
ncbi:MAG: hypothetical protein ACO3E3_03790 [Candidatus Limnocylindrus sp.]